jgi:hypothetical protein
MKSLRETQVNPVPVIAIAVVLLLGLGYLFIIRPNQAQAKIEKQWVTPDAAEARHDGRKPDAAKEQMIQQLRAKEGLSPAATHARRRDRD